MTLSSYDVFQQSRRLPGYQTLMLGQILTNETDPLFSWQYNEVFSSYSQFEKEKRDGANEGIVLSLSEWVC